MPHHVDVEVRTGLRYGSTPGADLDLYLPRAVAAPPVVVYVHGGAWLMGERTDFAERFTALADEGVAVASIDYRTSNRGAYPAQAEDIAAAAGWGRDNAAELGVSAGPVVVMGSSAGAHLSALATLTGAAGDVAGLVGL